MNIQKIGCVGVDWIEVAQDTGRWRGLGNALMKFRVS
jgi:hypothetical protein